MDLKRWLKKSAWYGLWSLLPLALFASLADAAMLYGVRSFVQILTKTAVFSLGFWAIGMLLLIGLRFVLLVVRGNVMERICRRLEAGLRAWFARRLRNLHPRFFHDKENDGKLQSAYDATQILPSSGEALMQALQAILQLLVFFPVLFYLSTPLTIVLLFVVLPIVAYVQRKLHSMGPAVEGQMVKQGELRTSLETAKKIFHSWSSLFERIAASQMLLSRIRELFTIGLHVGRKKVMLSQSMETLSLVSMVVVLAFCAWMIAMDWMNPEGLILYCSALFLCYKPVKECTRLVPQLRMVKSAYHLLTVLSLYPSRGEHGLSAGEAISLEAVSFGYQGSEVPVFKNKNERWMPTPRKHLLICGPNGAGKTTLLRLIANLEEADSGKIQLPESLVEEGIFLVSQEVYLPPLEWLRRQLDLRKKHSPNDAVLEHFLTVSGASKLLYKDGYSGGEKSRLALLWALASPSKLLLLDEPFAFIARKDRTPLLSAFLDSADALGKWVLLTSHEELDASLLSRLECVEVGA